MTDKTTCELYIAMNEDGGWIVTADESEAMYRLNEEEGGYQCRIIKIVVKMTPPVIPAALVDVPDSSGTTVETEAT
jgi:hypothetical protein